ncbi:PilZ domain-containing protein [Sphingomonas jinjuensis]|nr:PilZ domain-containing protein [Sphingomonas jinjuensis]
MTALQSGLRPREPRVKVVVPCRMNVNGAWSDACIHNVSSRGLLVAGAKGAPAVGSYVDIRRGSLVMIGRVMWQKDRFFGVRVQDKVNARALVAEPRGRRKASRDGSEVSRSARALAHEGNVARRVERSRAIAAAFQSSLLVLGGGGAAVFVALEVYEALAAPMETVRQAMGG